MRTGREHGFSADLCASGSLNLVRSLGSLILLGGLALVAIPGGAETCLSQAKMTAGQRAEVGATAYRLATAVQKSDTAAVQTGTIAPYATNFEPTAYLIRNTASGLAGDTLAVQQAYLLDATNRTANDSSDANFNCPLVGTSAETDFSINGLPGGRYAFVTVEAAGPRPWLLSFLLESEAGGWKMAGFYPHAREAAGHNGLWYWSAARNDAKAGKPWLAWVLYGEADQLLRPANFVSSTNLDRLRSELRNSAPPTLSDGISAATPLALPGAHGADYAITGLNSQASEDGKQLNLLVHLRAEASATPGTANTATARNQAAGNALIAAHPELRGGFDNLWVLAEAPGSNPVVTVRPMAEVLAPK